MESTGKTWYQLSRFSFPSNGLFPKSLIEVHKKSVPEYVPNKPRTFKPRKPNTKRRKAKTPRKTEEVIPVAEKQKQNPAIDFISISTYYVST